MWVVIWTAIVIAGNTVMPTHSVDGPFGDEETCKEFVDTYESRTKDFMRGRFNVDFTSEVIIEARCVQKSGQDT